MSFFPQAISSNVNSKSTDTSLDIDLPFYRQLGRTDLTVSCLGLGGGGGISSEDTLYAFEQGMNYFFYSTDLHHSTYSSMSNGLQKLCRRGSSVRDKVVLATVTYIKSPEAILGILFDQFKELGVDYIDIFFWGWVGKNDKQAIHDCLELSPSLRGSNSYFQKIVENMFDASELMKKMGIVRYVGASFHDINLAKECLHNPLLDVVMVRSNVTHRYAQSQIFNKLDPNDPQRPGIVNFKSTSCSSGLLWEAPINLPEGCWIPKAPDLYRYCLSQNSMDVCLTGLQNKAQIDAAIAGVKKGKLTPEEIKYLNLYGDLYNNPWKLKIVSPEDLIYRD